LALPAGRRAPVNVETTTVKEISVHRTVDLSGTPISLDQAKVSSDVAGVVERVRDELGAEVRSAMSGAGL
jgi:hypothetical protein